MNDIARAIDWADTNQACLVAEFARLKNQLGAEAEMPTGLPVEALRAAMPSLPAIDRLCELFGLSVFERDILLLCAGVEMDSRLASLCSEAQGYGPNPPARACITFGLTMAVLPDAHWSALAPDRPLRRFRLVQLESDKGLTTAPLRIDERVLHYLAGINLLDPSLRPLLRECPSADGIADNHCAVAGAVQSALALPDPPVMQLFGDDPDGQEDVAALAARRASLTLFSAHAVDLAAMQEPGQFAALWERETMLLPAALLLHCGANGLSGVSRQLAERLPTPLFLASREPLPLSRALVRFEIDKPSPAEQKRLWQQALATASEPLSGVADQLSAHFWLSARTIFATGRLPAIDRDTPAPAALWRACRSLARPRLEDMAQRIVPIADWDDLVLPEAQMQTLRRLADHVHHRMTVHESWGFSRGGNRGLGIGALFAGGSGTGKTLAAEVVALALDLDLYRIDLSAVVNKYIGETEKNLKRVFDAAEEGGVLLLFDEADALFAKRGDVKDAHDRYANIEVGYLLQRMETYRGLAVLTTNLKSTIDKAFQRRLRFVVHFPFPDAAQREAIWRHAFPPATPTRDLDPRLLSQLNMAGGNIRNIALNAAFLAAAQGQPVAMAQVLEAARWEADKIERPLTEAEIRGWQ
jgi:ATPase family associated with various cellular activities (AAA)